MVTSIALFDSLGIPVIVMIMSKCVFRRKYNSLHLIGALVCLVGVTFNALAKYCFDCRQ
jgi:drug/metabolite transporter (DMT)-like permease